MANCTRCKNKLPDINFKMCSDCRNYLSQKEKQRRLKRINDNCCSRCGKFKIDNSCKCTYTASTIRRQTRRIAGVCYYCGSPSNGRSRCDDCTIRDVDGNRRRRIEYRNIVIQHYGAKCACCGESTPIFIGLDHINGDGSKHRKSLGHGDRYWKWFIDNNFPKDYQTLCHNCNMGREINGGFCPGARAIHKLTKPNLELTKQESYPQVVVSPDLQ